MNERIMLLYPPSPLYQRGEDRCQSNIEASTATSIRACNDLGYCAATLKQRGYDVFLRDYQTEGATFADVEADTLKYQPQLAMISVTNATIFDDIAFAQKLRAVFNMRIVLKGAIFYDAEPDMLSILDLSQVDYLIGTEAETCIAEIADCALRGAGQIAQVDNIFYKDEQGQFLPTRFNIWVTDLDAIPFPARGSMNNRLYIRPDTRRPMATIQTSRGCPAACTYCLSPTISGKKLRTRSPENVLEELKDCYFNHSIRDFFFRADTFTFDGKWTIALCDLIIHSPLAGKIQFTANSRTKPLSRDVLAAMKRAGCFSVAFGFESGSEETLSRIKKGASKADNLQAARWCHELGLSIFGFYMIGFPWETQTHLEETRRHIFETRPDFLEVHIALPYYGTDLYEHCKRRGLLTESPLGSDYFHASLTGTEFVSGAELESFRKKLIRDYYLRPIYILKRLAECVRHPVVLSGYASYGLRMLKASH